MKRMGYHATLSYGNSAWGATGFRRVGSTTVPRCAVVRAWRVAGGGGPHVGRDADDRLPLVCGLEGRRPEGPERRRSTAGPGRDSPLLFLAVAADSPRQSSLSINPFRRSHI